MGGSVKSFSMCGWTDAQSFCDSPGEKGGATPPALYMELPYQHMESIDWLEKGTAFFRAKLFGEKYEGSF